MPKVRLQRQSIAKTQTETVHQAPATRVRIIVDGKSFPMDEIDTLENLSGVLDVVQRNAGTFRRPTAYLNNIRPFLQCCSMHGRVDAQALEKYRKQVSAERVHGHNTKYNYFNYALNLTRHLIDAEVIPDFEFPEGFKTVEAEAKANLFDLSPMSWDDASDKIKDLAVERFRLNDVGQEAALVAAILSTRLEAIRRAAKSEIAEIYDGFIRTQSLIDEAKKSGKFASLNSLEYFPEQIEIDDAIIWAFAKYGPIVPQSTTCDQRFYSFVKAKLGGFGGLQKRLAPNSDALAPFLALHLSEHALAPNVDGVTRYTYRGCLGSGESHATQVVTFGKWRGKPREISRELSRGRPGEWTLPRALEFLHTYTGRLLEENLRIDPRIDGNDGFRLYIHYDKIRNNWVTHLDAGSVNYTLRRFLKRASLTEPDILPIADIIRADSFRPSIALLDRMEGRSIFRTQRLLAHNNPEMTAKYTDRQSVASLGPLHELSFQRFISQKIAGAQKEVPQDAVAVGNGFYCTDPTSGGPRQETVDEVCASHDLCDRRCAASVIVVEDPTSVAQWIAWHRHIEANRATLRNISEDRWHFWERRSALYQVLIEKTSARSKRLAQLHVAQIVRTLPSLT